MKLPAARWRPDVSNLNSQYASDVMNVLCAADSYIPFPKLVAFSSALPSAPISGFTGLGSDNAVNIFIGTGGKLYKLNNTTLGWDHVSKLSADQAVNGVFAADVSWTKGTNWTIAAGVATATASPSGQTLSQAQSFTAGNIYKVVYTVSGFSAGGVRPRFTGGTTVNGTTRTANGTYTEYLTAVTGNNNFSFEAVGTTTLNLDNVTVQSLANYGATVDERWKFTQYGNYIVAVNINDNPQVFQLGVSNEFADLAGSPPRARHVAVWGDFLALGGLTGFTTRVHWSGLGDITQWTPGTNSSDYQDFPDGFNVQGMTEATNPIIFQRAAIRFGTFVPGSSEVFTFTKVHEKRGAASPYAIASRGMYTFFVDNGQFFQIGTDGSIKPIGLEKINRTVFSNVTGPNLLAIIGAVDPFYNRVYFACRYSSTDTSYDRILVYDWEIGEWTQQSGTTNTLFPLASGTVGTTLEALDALYASLEAVPFSLDSSVWQGGAPIMAAVDSNYRLGFYSGTNAEATMTTQEFGDTSGAMTRITKVMPLIDTSSVYISFKTRNRRGVAFATTSEASPSTNTGIVRKNVRARFIQVKTRVAEDAIWSHFQGADADVTKAGYR